MGPRRCYLCNRERSNEIALHKIPKDPGTSAAWVKFCKLNVTYDDISKVEICSNHFDVKDFINPRAKEFVGKLKLKLGAVPSTSISRNLLKMDPVQAQGNLTLSVPGPSDAEPSTPKRKRFSQPRYVGEIRSPHLVTPRRAKKMLTLASQKIDVQAKKIKILQQKNRRLVKKVKKLDDLLNHLKKNNLISENCAEFMMTANKKRKRLTCEDAEEGLQENLPVLVDSNVNKDTSSVVKKLKLDVQNLKRKSGW
ncbi:hypothetical protein RN001_003250 [Aquatica leii]|uniref:THAP-type domain-containing protein n=1 Tax=Aquatica leii TaxID=1421715 RepID=A0AAN7SM74_9COLE|nr:hypothetical protein RN001_003250 [Aquatica leii]